MRRSPVSRRDFLAASAAVAGTALLPASARAASAISFRYGLVTYMWGAEWDLPTLLKNCKATGCSGVELRTTHAHKVEPTLTAEQREDVAKRFADSGVVCVGIGSNERFDNPDAKVVAKAVEASKEFIRLSHDIGGSGVKVKPDQFHKDVPHEKTIEQIGKALNELGEYAAGFGQEVRLEVHGGCSELPVIKAIMDIATDENVVVCWNSNVSDLKGDGLEANSKLVRKRFGHTLHVRELDAADYPFPKLIELLVKSDYDGWVLCEAASKQDDKVAALKKQKQLFDEYVAAVK